MKTSSTSISFFFYTSSYIKHKLPYINKDKIAIWGKGFGGFLVTSLISRDSLFNCAIAVSPVTSWRNYLSVFIERYMGLPWSKDNYINYDKTDLMQNIFNIRDKEFLIVHGTADRKVNIQHSMLLMKALTENNIPFRLQVSKLI